MLLPTVLLNQGVGFLTTAAVFYISASGFLSRLTDLVNTIDQQKQEIEYLATHDTLTKLPTLRLALDRLDVAISKAKRSGDKVALLFIDIDGFKQVNDNYGHEAGDVVLQSVAQRLLDRIREIDTACRIGGDEFIVLLTGIGNLDSVDQISKQLIEFIG